MRLDGGRMAAGVLALATGRPILWGSLAIGAALYLVLPVGPGSLRAILAWDGGATAPPAAYAAWFGLRGERHLEADAERQRTGEWAVFCLSVGAAVFSLLAVVAEFSHGQGLPAGRRDARIAVVGGTLLLSWLVVHTLFALRYAHEYYDRAPGAATVDGGLEFPGEARPDYWDFLYFSLVLGMTFQVSDVQITSRELRRLATVHGLVAFLFNTVVVALTVNMGANLG